MYDTVTNSLLVGSQNISRSLTLGLAALLGLSMVGCQLVPEMESADKPQPPSDIITVVECPSVPEPVCPVVKCPQVPKATANKSGVQAPIPVLGIDADYGDKVLIGRVENITLSPGGLVLKARIDTGAGLSSLNALDLTHFERDGKPWVRFAVLKPESSEKIFFERAVRKMKNIKQLGKEPQRRPVVKMGVSLGGIDEQVDMTLTDRSGYLYQALIGRNFLRDAAVVDVSRKFVVSAGATH